MVRITDENMSWHYSEVKQQFHFVCELNGCKCETDILGRYAYCPRCGLSNARRVFFETVRSEIARIDRARNEIVDRHERERLWETMTINGLSQLEAVSKHLRRRLRRFPLTARRRKDLDNLNFQQPVAADGLLKEWFDVGFFEWMGAPRNPCRQVADSDRTFIGRMIQKRHILMHNGGLVDQDYIDKTHDTSVELDERIRIRSKEVQRFLTLICDMVQNFLDNVEYGFSEGENA